LKDVLVGISSSKIFQRFTIPQEFDSNCISLVSSKRTLDIRKDDDNICKQWVHAFKYLIKRQRSINEVQKKSLRDSVNKSEIISDFWKTEILPNWKLYRKYIIVKGKDFSRLTNKTKKIK